MLTQQHGDVRIGGAPLDGFTAEQRRRHVAIISQDVHVFAGPLVDDLRLTQPEATDAEISAALETVGAAEWTAALEDGVHTVVGEGGHELTAAQAQQLALARLLLLDPTVAILDEATAEAGSLGARDLERAAAAVTEGRTTLVVAHGLTRGRHRRSDRGDGARRHRRRRHPRRTARGARTLRPTGAPGPRITRMRRGRAADDDRDRGERSDGEVPTD